MRNTSNKSRNGNRSLNRSLVRRCNRHLSTMLGGARRPREPHPLRQACQLLSTCIRISKSMAKRDPHLFGPRASEYYRDTLRMEQVERDIDDALRKVYGPSPPGQPDRVSTPWTDRYVGSSPKRRRALLKWFKHQYPS